MKYLIGLGVAVLVVIAFAYFWLFSSSEPQTVQDQAEKAIAKSETQSNNEAQEFELNGFGTMYDLLAREQNLECQITTIDNSAVSEGTFFVADQKIRGDFMAETPDMEGSSVSSVIIADNTMFVWTEIDGELYGVKSQMQTATEAEVQTQEPVSLDERVKYSCQNWKPVDQSIFVPPGDVMFQDLSEILQGGLEYGTIYEEGELSQ
jgi:hypothetical protein